MNMKKTIALILALLLALSAVSALAASKSVKIDKKNFPDAGFRGYVASLFDKNSDGALSEAECKAVKKIEIGPWNEKYPVKKCANLKGIEHFPNLTSIWAIDVGLTKLDVSNNKNLKELRIDDNKLTKLDLSKNTKLEALNCQRNRLTSLKLGKNKKLKEFDIEDNKLTKVDVGGCTQLKKIFKTHIVVERYETKLGWRLGYPFQVFTDTKTKIMDGKKTLYKMGKVKSISLTNAQKNVTLKVGQLWQPSYTVKPATAACFIQAEPKDRTILEVPYDDNTMKALKKGTTTVTIKTEYGQTAKIKVTIK